MMSIICTMTPSAVNFGESLNTLKFASRAKRIVSRAIVNRVDDETALIIKYQTEIAKLKSELSLAQQEAKRVQQQQQLQKQQQQRPKRPPRPLLSREDAMKNRELRNALKQAIENIGRVILNSKQSQHYQTSTAASRIRRRQGQRRKRRERASSSSSSSSSLRPLGLLKERRARGRPEEGRPTMKKTAGESRSSNGEQCQRLPVQLRRTLRLLSTIPPRATHLSTLLVAVLETIPPLNPPRTALGLPRTTLTFSRRTTAGTISQPQMPLSWRARRHGFSSAPPTPFRRRA